MDLRLWIEQYNAGKEMPLNLSTSQQDLHGLYLMEAIEAHEAWIEKLEKTLRGQNPEEYDPAILGADHLCKVGKWLYGEGQSLDKYPEYEVVRNAHARFHTCAGNILQNHKKGYLMEAIHALRHELIDLSKEVKVALVSLLAKVQNV